MRGNSIFKNIDRWIGIPLVLFFSLLTRLGAFFTGKPSRPLTPSDQVLVVKLSALGDTLLLLPVLKAVKKRVGPQGRVIMVVTPINQSALQDCPFVDQVLILDFGKVLRNPLKLFSFLWLLKKQKAAIALDFDQWLRISPLLCLASGAAERLGFRTPGQYRHFLYHDTVENRKDPHEFEQFASVAALAGIQRQEIENFDGFLEREKLFRSPPEDFKPGKDPLVHFHPGCGSHGWQREWPAESYARLAQGLRQKLGAGIQITGAGKHEEELAREISEKSRLDLKNLCGRLELPELANLLRRADLVVCGNTGIMHLAVGLGRPLIALHGPTDPVKWGPLASQARVLSANLLCSPCLNLGFEYGCPYRSCMESIEVGTVLRECLNLLGAP